MERFAAKRARLTRRFNELVDGNASGRSLRRSWSNFARSALNEANTLSTERVSISLRRLPKRMDGLRIVHLSDLHHSPQTGLDHIQRAIEVANRLDPDIVALTGDFVSHETKYIAPLAAALAKLSAKHGVYACLGNHDHWTDPDLVTLMLRGEGIKVLVNQGFRLETNEGSFWLAGVDDHMVGKTDVPASLVGSYPDEMKLLLAHNPIIFREAARLGVDLTLSGHTHGGQIRVRNSERKIIPRRRNAGLYDLRDAQMYITRGIGTVVVPVRYQCPPEVTLLELRSTVQTNTTII